ncbi:MAG: DEAD/DEAH box helicase [Desulfobacterales bacterium]|jgi:DEAD/DEAH box helicase domain-containing protein
MTISPIERFLEALRISDRSGGDIRFHRVLSTESAVFDTPERPFHPAVTTVLKKGKIDTLYQHQSRAIDAVRKGLHVVVSSPTASGKSLIYQIPALENALESMENRALFLFPLKALAQDQLSAFDTLTALLPNQVPRPKAAIYDGDTSPWHRKKIRSMPPQVIISNPDMLHLGFLAHHRQWEDFFRHLKIVVVDEVHTLKGIFGAHMSQVFWRLRRICRLYGADPVFIFCTATVANPRSHCEALSGLKVMRVRGQSGSRGKRHVMIVDPVDGLTGCVLRLLGTALESGLKTIVYTQSRKLTEWIGLQARHRFGNRGHRVGIYRSGLLPEDRRRVETQMAEGDLKAVVTTSALELGIDIGALDLCILAGYPGTLISTWQRAGRVGRNGQASALIMVPGEDALDRFFLRHPLELIRRTAEAAVINPVNPKVLDQHLPCAAVEHPLSSAEIAGLPPEVRKAAERLILGGRLLVDAEGKNAHSPQRSPHRHISLRGGGVSWQLFNAKTGERFGEIDGSRVFRETHPGAIYLHSGDTYLIEAQNPEKRTVSAAPMAVDYFTRPRGWKDTEITQILKNKIILNTNGYFGKVNVKEQTTGFERIHSKNGKSLGVRPLKMPVQTLETEAFWLLVPPTVIRHIEQEMYHFMGSIHALEHAMIGILPLLVMTDRNDIGGIAMPRHPQTGGAAIFIYDGIEGGAGFSKGAYDAATELLEKAMAVIEGCPCDNGCPSCVHSPKCGSGNRPIDKDGAALLIKTLKQDRPRSSEASTATIRVSKGNRQAAVHKSKPLRYGVFDLETQKSAAEVGGWHLACRMRVSCAVLFDAKDGGFHEYMEKDVPGLISHLKDLDLVVGFNSLKFDYRVLTAYSRFDFRRLQSLDLLEEIRSILGYRLSLDHLAKETLGTPKTADGLTALKWWKEGKIPELLAYCRSDVAITRDLYRFGRDRGYLLFKNKAGMRVRAQASWGLSSPSSFLQG